MAKVNIVVDASQYDLFRLCEQRFYYRYKLSLAPAGDQNENLDRGNLIHVCNEVYYESLKSGAKYEYAANSALMKLKAAAVTQSDLDNEHVNLIIKTMEEYFDYWRVADQNLEIIEVEKPFMYLLYEDDEVRIYMAGKIDLIVNEKDYKNLPYDHKSFKRSGEVARMSNQFKNYCVAAESNFLVVNRIGLQKTLKSHEKYYRTRLTYDKLMLDAWKENTIKVLMYYLQCEATGSWPLNETSCDKYNRKCEYYEVCDSSGQEAKDHKLMMNFIRVEPWDVTKVLRKSSEMLKDADNKPL